MAKQGAKTVTPRLRFPEFREANVWETAKIGAKTVSFSGGTPDTAKKELYGGSIPFIRSAEIGRETTELSLTEEGVQASAAKLVTCGDVLVALYGANSGEVALAKIDGAINQAILCLRSSQSNPFLYQYLSAKKDWITSTYLQGGQGNLSGDIIKSIVFGFPSALEQQKIADCLTSLDEVIAAQGRMVEALKAHKRGLMQQLFPREGEAHPRLRFPEFRDAPEWAAGKASDIVEVLQGYGFPERLQGNKEAEFPFYKVSDISACVDAGGTFLADAKNHIDAAVLEELRARLLPAGTTVFAKIGEAIRSNKRAIVTRPCLVDNNAAGVKALQGLAEDRFVYYLWSQIPLIEYSGGVVPAVNKSTIEQIQVRYPDIDEQQRIADCLSSLDTKIAAASSQLSSLRLHKQGLMQQLFPTPMED